MGWTNTIPNPFVVGGGGISGRIEVYDAAGVLLATIDEDGIIFYDNGVEITVQDEIGLTVLGEDNSYVRLLIDDQVSATDTPAVQFRPVDAVANPTYTMSPAVILAESVPGDGYLSLYSPSIDGAERGHFQIWAAGDPGLSGPYSSIIGEAGYVLLDAADMNTVDALIEIFSDGTISMVGEDGISLTTFGGNDIELDGAVIVDGNLLPNSVSGILPAAFGANTQTSASYGYLADGGGNLFNAAFTKVDDNSRIEVTLHVGCFTTALGTNVRWGVEVFNSGTTVDIASFFFNQASVHHQMSGSTIISGVPAGTYGVYPKWRRSAGAGTLTTDSNDWISMIVREIHP